MTNFRKLNELFSSNHYDLSIDLRPATKTFSGEVTIYGTMKSTSSDIVLHSKDLKIKKVLVNDIPADSSLGDNDELIIKPTSKPLKKEISVTISFSGKITDAMHGVYPCYFSHNGKQKQLLATQFESHHAREAFPCVDEPAAKATFDLTLTTDPEVTALSNMPVRSQETVKDHLKTSFETTPKMSPYLLAFVVGEMHSISGKTNGGIDVNIWATVAQTKDSMKFALDVATRSIDFFDDYFGTKYPLPKADHVALPDFSSAAMENWGLVTYRESCLLADSSTAVSTKQLIASVIGHETSHQWFGNLVTMAWWDDLWLNESFANMMQHVVVDALFPNWKIWNQFASHEGLIALRRDSLPGVQSVHTEVNHPDEIGTLFDPAIVYAKGGNLLNMLRQFIGEKAFKKGLSEYFKKHAYSNTTGEDLWSALSGTSGKDVGAFMNAWLTQSGFPVVDAQLRKGILTLSQSHFVIGSEPQEKQWPIPLFANDTNVPEVLETESVECEMHERYLKLNQNDSSYFITDYDDTLFSKLLAHIEDLSDVDKLQVLNEANLLSKAMRKEASTLIDLINAYKHETLYSVWDVMSLLLADLKRFSESDDIVEDQLKRFAGSVVNNLYSELGWKAKKTDTEDTHKLRAIAIGLTLYSEENSAIAKALELYEGVDDIAKLDGELRSLILGVAVRFSPQRDKVVTDLLKYHKNTNSNDLQNDITAALCSTRDVKTVKKLLGLINDTTIIRPQDATMWFAHLIRNKYARPEAWQWLTSNWDWVEEHFKNDHHYSNFVYYSAAAFCDSTYLAKFEEFFAPKRDQVALTRTIDIGISEISSRAQWIKTNRKAVAQRLASL